MSVSRRNFIQAGGAMAAVPASLRPSPANDRINIGVIGTGARSHELIQALMQLPGMEIVGVVDAYKGRVERALDRIGKNAKAYATYQDLLAQKSIDAVLVVTPDHWHRRMVLDAIAAGKDVYCEKPLTFKSSEGLEIAQAAKAAERIVQVGSQGMSTPIQQKAREMVRSGKLGKVTMVRAAYNRNSASGAWVYPIPPDASPNTVNWEMFLGPAPKRPYSLERFFRWRCYEDYSGGIATDLFVHLCTTIHYVMGAKAPSRVMAMGELYRWKDGRDVPDTLNAVLEYPDGFTVNLSSTFNNQMTGEGSFQFLGTEGAVTLGAGLTYYPETAVEDNRWIVESWPRKLEDAYYKDPNVRATELLATRPPAIVEGTQTFRQTGLESSVIHLGHFLASIRSRQPYWEDALAGHRAAACAHMVNMSVKQHRMIEWDSARDDIKS